MKRKQFIAALFPLAVSGNALAQMKNISASFDEGPEDGNMKKLTPPYLTKGAVIGITCPAGNITLDEIEPAIAKIKEWGFEVKAGNTVGKKDFTFGGTDGERLTDFQQMLDDTTIKAILCARGGYGALRIIDKIDFTKFVANPKWVIGFSDVTVLHNHINRNFGIASIHSKMCNSFPTDWSRAEPIQIETIESIRQCLMGDKMQYNVVPNTNNKSGTATGILVGGNLKTIETLAGSKSDLVTKNKILFVEDTGEYLYSIDRMFWNLKRTGKLDKLAALIIGGFKIKKDDTEAEAFGKTLEEIVLEKVTAFNYPVCFDFPVGHQKNNFALKCGVKHLLTASDSNCLLKEI